MGHITEKSSARRVRDPNVERRFVKQAFVQAAFNAKPVANVVGMDLLQVRDLMTRKVRSQDGHPPLECQSAQPFQSDSFLNIEKLKAGVF